MGQRAFLGAFVAAVLGGCAGSADETSTSTQAVTATNGLFQNGLTTNGVYQNGVYQNGVYQNGVYQNGVYQNGVYQNGVYQNGVYQNGVYQNGVYQNGVYQNGVYQNGVYQNGVWESGLWSNDVWQVGTNADALRSNFYTRQFMQYVYACSFPAGMDASLDPNGGTLACGTNGACDAGYACVDNKCVVPLKGAIGVGVNADGTTWAASGRCDESCQRWVSACVLARTNAYGVTVDISMRAPEDAPQAVKDALRVTPDEAAAYPLQEGAFYGNLFASTPVNPPPSPTYTGPDTGPVMATPVLTACAGPGSNIPDLTKRFCSSQGDKAVISVPGVCLQSGAEAPTCQSVDGGGAMHNCYTSTSWAGQRPYKEVITVFLKKPIAVCGNSVCEIDSENVDNCPSDCHAGTWASTFDRPLFNTEQLYQSGPGAGGGFYKNSTVTPDGDVVIAGVVNGAINLGCGSVGAPGQLVITKLRPDRSCAWSKAFAAGISSVRSVAANAQTIAVLGGQHELKVATFDITGAPVLATTTIATAFGVWPTHLGLDSANNLFLTATLDERTTPFAIGGTTLSPLFTDRSTAFISKLSPQGVPQWSVIPSSAQWITSLAVGPDGNPWITVVPPYGGESDYVAKLDGNCNPATSTTGCVLLKKPATTAGLQQFCSVAVDSAGAAYVQAVGSIGRGYVQKYSPTDGHTIWSAPQQWYAWANRCDLVSAQLSVDEAAGDVVSSAYYGGFYITDADFGAGVFQSYGTSDLFVAAYSTRDELPLSGKRFSWAKTVPMVLQSAHSGIAATGGRVFLTGSYSGSMIVDDTMLVNKIPEQVLNPNAYIASFPAPPPSPLPPEIEHVPQTILVEATAANGSKAFFMPPTALDDTGAGVTVNCVPAPNTLLSIGSHTITCTATNARGVSSTQQFTIEIVDRSGPLLSDVPASTTVDATVRAGVAVPFTPPTAYDQVDGDRPVTCVPAPGATFPIGTTIVRCSASDTRGHTTEATFNVVVNPPPDTTPPVITVPGSMLVNAASALGSVVTYSATATDDVDGDVPVSCTPPSGTTFALGATEVTCTASDATGNAALERFTITVADLEAPTITILVPATVEATGPSGAPVTYVATVTDNVDTTVAVACSPLPGTFALGATLISCVAQDAAGNIGTAAAAVDVVDTTPPAITVPANISLTATSAAGATATFTTSATDIVDGAVTTSCSHTSGSTFALGTTTVACTAQDAAGNASSKSFTVTVTVAGTFFLQPINLDNSSIFRLGSTVPIKFQLTGVSAGITNLVADVRLAKVANSIAGSTVEAITNVSADNGSAFRYDANSGQYIYNLATSSLSRGTWRLWIDAHDGAIHTVDISLK